MFLRGFLRIRGFWETVRGPRGDWEGLTGITSKLGFGGSLDSHIVVNFQRLSKD